MAAGRIQLRARLTRWQLGGSWHTLHSGSRLGCSKLLLVHWRLRGLLLLRSIHDMPCNGHCWLLLWPRWWWLLLMLLLHLLLHKHDRQPHCHLLLLLLLVLLLLLQHRHMA
jgi:hypothetical protein